MINKKEIGQRLRDFVEKSFDNNVSALTKKLGLTRSYFTPYFNGDSILGGEMLSKLSEFGLDINWLLNGVTITNTGKDICGENMPYETIIEENKKLKECIKDLKIRAFDAETDNSVLKLQIEQLEHENKILKSKLDKFMDKGLSTQQ